MVLPKTYKDEEEGDGDDDEEWSALKGNTLHGLSERRTERSWMYVRRKAGERMKDRVVQKLSKTKDMTKWKPRLTEVTIDPKNLNASHLRITKFDEAAVVKQELDLQRLENVEKLYLPPADALEFPLKTVSQLTRFGSPAVFAPDAESQGEPEYRFGHLVLSLSGTNSSGQLFYSELACASTQERDAWVQLFQDYLLLCEMKKLRAFGSTEGQVNLSRNIPRIKELDFTTHVEFFRSGIKNDQNKDLARGGAGLRLDVPPKFDIIVRLPNEDRGSVRRITASQVEGCINISNLIFGWVPAGSVTVDLTQFLISVVSHDFNQFMLKPLEGISQSDQSASFVESNLKQCIRIEIAGGKDDQKARNAWVAWLLFVKAAPKMFKAISDKKWVPVTDQQTHASGYYEVDGTPPRFAYMNFPKDVEWSSEMDQKYDKRIFYRVDNNAAGVFLETGQQVVKKGAYDFNEIFQQSKEETFGLNHIKVSLKMLEDHGVNTVLDDQNGEQTTAELQSQFIEDQRLLYVVEDQDDDTFRHPNRPEPWSIYDPELYKSIPKRLQNNVPIRFTEFLEAGNPVYEWFELPLEHPLSDGDCEIGLYDAESLDEAGVATDKLFNDFENGRGKTEEPAAVKAPDTILLELADLHQKINWEANAKVQQTISKKIVEANKSSGIHIDDDHDTESNEKSENNYSDEGQETAPTPSSSSSTSSRTNFKNQNTFLAVPKLPFGAIPGIGPSTVQPIATPINSTRRPIEQRRETPQKQIHKSHCSIHSMGGKEFFVVSQGAGKKKEKIPISELLVVVEVGSAGFKVSGTKGRSWAFTASTRQERDSWVSKLRSLLENDIERARHLLSTPRSPAPVVHPHQELASLLGQSPLSQAPPPVLFPSPTGVNPHPVISGGASYRYNPHPTLAESWAILSEGKQKPSHGGGGGGVHKFKAPLPPPGIHFTSL